MARLIQHSTLPVQELVPQLLGKLQARFLQGEHLLAGQGSAQAACRVLSCLGAQLPAGLGEHALLAPQPWEASFQRVLASSPHQPASGFGPELSTACSLLCFGFEIKTKLQPAGSCPAWGPTFWQV